MLKSSSLKSDDEYQINSGFQLDVL